MLSNEEFQSRCESLQIDGEPDYLEALNRHAQATIRSAQALNEISLENEIPAMLYNNQTEE